MSYKSSYILKSLLMLAFHALILYLVYNNFYTPFMDDYMSERRVKEIQEEYALTEIQIIPEKLSQKLEEGLEADDWAKDNDLAKASLTLPVYLAHDADKRAKGLMQVREMPDPAQGMLFLYDDLVQHPFWMKDTPLSLDIAFIDEDGFIREILTMEANTETLHSPADPYRMALELEAGSFKEKKIFPGAQIIILPEE